MGGGRLPSPYLLGVLIGELRRAEPEACARLADHLERLAVERPDAGGRGRNPPTHRPRAPRRRGCAERRRRLMAVPAWCSSATAASGWSSTDRPARRAHG